MRGLHTIHGRRMLTFILAGGRGERLYPLTKERSKPSVPFGGGFRVIDFVLSNCINSQLRQIFLLTQTKSQSLDNHIRFGWNFLSEVLGEFILTVPAQQRIGERWYQGSADAIFQNLNVIEEYRPDLVLVLSGDHIYRMNYRDMVQAHLEHGAALTLPSATLPKAEALSFGVLDCGPDGRVRDFVEKPAREAEVPGPGDTCEINTGIYLFDTETLVREVVRDAQTDSAHDFGRNILPAVVASQPVHAVPMRDNRLGNYWRDIGTIDSYHRASMDLLGDAGSVLLSGNEWPIYPVGRTGHPSRFPGRACRVERSLVAAGCTLHDCTVINSIISTGVTIHEGCTVENAVILNNSELEAGSTVRNAILDKNTYLARGSGVGVDPEHDRRYFSISPGGIAVVPKDYRYPPPGTPLPGT